MDPGKIFQDMLGLIESGAIYCCRGGRIPKMEECGRQHGLRDGLIQRQFAQAVMVNTPPLF